MRTVAAAFLTLPLAMTLTLLGARLVASPQAAKPVPAAYTPLGVEPKTPFTPGRQRTSHGQLLPVAALAGSFSCGGVGCHAQIVDEWTSSSHRHAARNDHYRAQVKLRIHDVPVKPHAGARFCSGCHEPIAVLSGEVDPGGRGIDFAENLDEGISCLACHRMVDVPDSRGNAGYVQAPFRPYAGQGQGGLAGLIARASIRAKPEAHREELMRPLLRDSIACAPCHRLTVGRGINPNGLFIIQETYDEWRLTKYARSPDPAERRRCQDCHMPLVPSTDPAAKNGHHRSHRFFGSNTMRPWLDGDKEQLDLTQKFLRGGSVTLSARVDGRPRRGARVRLVTGVTNKVVGHRFPTGTVHMHDVWIEVVVTDVGGQTIFASGFIDPTENVDPKAISYRSVPRDRNGEWLYRRDMWNLASFLLPDVQEAQLAPSRIEGPSDTFHLITTRMMRTIWPGTTDEQSYGFEVPADARGPLSIRARLRFRKANQRFTDWVFDPRPLRDGSDYRGPHRQGVSMPVTDIDQVQLTADIE